MQITLIFQLYYLCLVQLRKVIISLVLLLVYTTGFAHNLIPHCHQHENNPDAHVHGHMHVDSHSHEHADHHHVDHGDHIDEGIYDYLYCVLSEMKHHDHDDAHIHFIQQIKPVNSLLIIAWAMVASEPSLEGLHNAYLIPNLYLESNYFSPLISNTPLRGPPQASC
ncbi:MAG: hypothetical protein CL840_07680 [Crocinitomicaceae bacterium]|nr:hypothetical protein [Crocinitomicaceae bacterium]|tara:strand:- start:12780 stop:13277 length:498 start_codon:yes stop_codon:yes gene_type:complete